MPKKSSPDEHEQVLRALQDAAGDDEEGGTDSGDAEGAAPREETEEVTTPSPPKTKGETKGKDKVGGKVAKKKAAAVPEERPVPTEPTNARRKKLTIVVSASGLVLIAVAIGGYLVLGGGGASDRSGTIQPPEGDGQQLVPRRIDGVLDDVEDQNRVPVAIMVENHTDSRPQSGLDKANLVYEGLAEGGITRFMAMYTFTDPVNEIGPVRSARPYFVDWARGYNALYVHIGGSPKALSRISSTNTADLNQFFNSQYFYRDRSRQVASEHTLFTSGRLMTLALIDKKVSALGSFQAWKFKKELPSDQRPASQHITINFSTFSYKVDYEYDPVTNEYARSQAEQPHVMRDGKPIRAKNVVVLSVTRRLEQPADGKGRLEMDTIGEGNARFFIDGKELTGTWKKASAEDQLTFYLENGSELEFNPGQTWVEVVPPEQEVTVR